MENKTHTIAFMSPSVTYLLLDRIYNMIDPNILQIDGLWEQIRRDLVDEYSREEANRMIQCCKSAIKSGKEDFKIEFRYMEFNPERQ